MVFRKGTISDSRTCESGWLGNWFISDTMGFLAESASCSESDNFCEHWILYHVRFIASTRIFCKMQPGVIYVAQAYEIC
jgi:hypothetical protein